MDYETESEILKALGHPVRLRIVKHLIYDECNVNKIIDIVGIPQSTISQHLGILKNRGILSMRKEGVKTCYRVSEDKVRSIIKILDK
jgi:ArsR family transcriptional regulator, arsenate/arsenite/antimonite-responsive transcriptional repressor